MPQSELQDILQQGHSVSPTVQLAPCVKAKQGGAHMAMYTLEFWKKFYEIYGGC